MALPSIQTAADSGRQRILQLITLGFAADPVLRWVWPDAKTYLEEMPKFVAAFGGRAFEHETAWYADDFRAAALWLPPGVEPDAEKLSNLIETTVAPETAEEAAALMGQMAEFHPHDRPCWYLPMIAADPACQGRGLGSALMKHAVRRCDEEGLPAYLESTNPRNVPLYERHGFEVMGEMQAGSSPVMHPMIREPR
ncbi:MAG: GNAT family N-acetyltransferase [Alphaproteobacteria bacterium]